MRILHIVMMVLLLAGEPLAAQDKKGTGPKERSVKMELKSNRQFRIEQREKRRQERAEKKAIKKHHKRIQTKKVRKRMKLNRKKSNRINDNKREPAIKRWFRKKFSKH